MKKTILTLCIALSTLISFSQTKLDSACCEAQKLAAIPDSSQITFKQVYSDVKSGISALAEGLKVGSEHVYGILCKQQLVNSITYLLLIIVLIIAFPVSINFGKKIYKADTDGIGAFFYIAMVVGVLLITSTIMAILHIQYIVMGFINPEYGAIKEILEIIKK